MARSPTRPLRWALACAPVVLVFLVYRGALDHPFAFDDHRTVLENASLQRPLDWQAVLHFDRFRPMVSLTYVADFLRGGKDPGAFHATNLVLHAANAGLVFWLLMGLFADIGRRESEQPERGRGWVGPGLACFGAAVFAVHPLLSESVSYVTGRSESVAAFFFLVALLSFRQDALGARSSGGAIWPWRVSWVLAWIAALASKETAAAFPLIALAWDRLLIAPAGERRRLLRLHLPLLLLTAAGGAVRLSGFLLQEAGTLPRSVATNVLTQIGVVWRYFALLLWPRGQSVVHAVDDRTRLLDPSVIIGLLAIGVTLWVAWRFRRARPWWLLGVVWFAACLAPSSSVIPLKELMAEHRVYLASLGLLLTLVAEARFQLGKRRGLGLVPVATLGTVVVLVLAALASARNQVWQNPVSLWSNAVAQASGVAEAHFGLGTALQREGRVREAIPAYQRAVELDPEHLDAQINLGICLAETEDYRGAYRRFRAVAELEPGHVRTYNNLAKLELMAGRVEEARKWLDLGLAADEGNVLARMSLAYIREQFDRDPAGALELCHEVRSLAPRTRGVEDCIARNEALVRAAGAS